MWKVLVCGSANFQNWRESYFWPKKLHEKVRETRQNGGKYDARQSWHSKNRKMNNKYRFSVTANTFAVQFWVYCVCSEVVTFEFLSRFVNPKLAIRNIRISFVDIAYPWRMVQTIRIDDLVRRKPLPNTYKCMCPTWEPNSGPSAKETAGTISLPLS